VDGALARYVKVKPQNLVALPDRISFEQGAVLTDAVATPYHALKARASIRIGESVAILGVGGLGIHAVMLARLLGAVPVIALDISRSKLRRAAAFGADYIINVGEGDPVEAIKSVTSGRGVDVALECVGSKQTVRWAVECVAIGGRVVVVGHSPEPLTLMGITDFVRKEVSLLGSSGFEIKEISQLVTLASSGRLDLSQSVTETLDLRHVNEGLARLSVHPEELIRLVVNSF
jgi:threonine dehydrogenase-like Zn-dependent dehydrogenase